MPDDAAEIMAQMKDNVTLDEFMQRNPKTITREERLQLIEIERRNRARFQTKERAKKEGK